jgi:prephenate dehydratase/chorismate mutase/prephenate dehydratase
MEIKDIRKRIKRLDYEMIKILNQRIELALRSTRVRENGLTEEEEQEFLEHFEHMHEGLIGKEFGRSLFRDIMEESRRVLGQGRKLAAFQGEHGANSEAALKAYSREFAGIPCRKFVDVFDGLKQGWFDYGLVPVENSLEGGVTEVNDLLIQNDLFICGEVKLRINHALMTLEETDYRGVRVVYSHPQALAQCRGFISRNDLEELPFYNTAGAARMLAELRPKGSAVIANPLCADIYELKIIKENIEDNSSNFTRFVLLSKEPCRQGNKCSVVFITPDTCGALNKVLTILAEAGINMSRIESRPSRIEPGNFAFLVDFNGSIDEDRIARALEAVEKNTNMYKLLGCYPEAPRINGE